MKHRRITIDAAGRAVVLPGGLAPAYASARSAPPPIVPQYNAPRASATSEPGECPDALPDVPRFRDVMRGITVTFGPARPTAVTAQHPLDAPQAGWYPDPEGREGWLRYWDGVGWSEHFHQGQTPA